MKQRIRTFLAVEINAAVRSGAAELIRKLSLVPADVKWVQPENLHLTLKFLDDVESKEIHQVCRAVGQAVGDAAPFELEVRGAGAFPNANRPRTVWLGAGCGSEEMTAVYDRIESSLEKLGFRREARRFHPHLTIGRVRRSGPALAELGNLIRQYGDFEIGRTNVNEVVVFSSELGPSGPTYHPLGRAPLGGK